MSEFIIIYQVEVFIALEVLSILFLIAFLFMRYTLTNQQASKVFLLLFILCIILEALLAIFIYQHTGEVSTVQVIIAIFVVYAFTFGIADFKKLDLFIKQKVGQWKGINLLTEADIRKIERGKDPKVIAKKNRIWWYIHALVFLVAHYIFWVKYGNHAHDLMFYLADLSWWGEDGMTNSPFQNEMIHYVNKIWTIVFAVDTIVSWSYTIFPDKEKS